MSSPTVAGFRQLSRFFYRLLRRLFLLGAHLNVLIEIIVEQRDFRIQVAGLFEHLSFLYARQNHIADSLLAQQLVDKLVHVNDFVLAHSILTSQLAVVVVERLKIFVAIARWCGEAQIECAECTHIFELFIANELDDDVLLGLNLQELEDEADERRWLDVAAVDAANEAQFHRFVDHQLGGEGEA